MLILTLCHAEPWKYAFANSVNLDQTAPAVWSVYAVFAILIFFFVYLFKKKCLYHKQTDRFWDRNVFQKFSMRRVKNWFPQYSSMVKPGWVFYSSVSYSQWNSSQSNLYSIPLTSMEMCINTCCYNSNVVNFCCHWHLKICLLAA